MALRQKAGKGSNEMKIVPPVVQGVRESVKTLEELLRDEEVCDGVFRKECVDGAEVADL